MCGLPPMLQQQLEACGGCPFPHMLASHSCPLCRGCTCGQLHPSPRRTPACGPPPRPQTVLLACLHPLMLQLLLLGAWRRCLSRADWARCRRWTKCLQELGQRVTRMPCTAIYALPGERSCSHGWKRASRDAQSVSGARSMTAMFAQSCQLLQPWMHTVRSLPGTLPATHDQVR